MQARWQLHPAQPSLRFLALRTRSTGERNGFTVLTEDEFFDFHLTTPDLNVMLIRVRGQPAAQHRGSTVVARAGQGSMPCAEGSFDG